MKKTALFALVFSLGVTAYAQETKQSFVATDIDNFWIAYDKIISTKDSAEQYGFLRDLYINKGTDGLRSLIAARNYSERQFIEFINNSPKFWASIRNNTVNVNGLYPEIQRDIDKLRKAYPELRPATIYFCIGAFRTNGTFHDNKILIGSELSLADPSTQIEELPAWRQPYYKTQHPLRETALLCTHEYVHTQQEELVENLLSKCLYEGVAEFVSCKVTGKTSTVPAIEFGKANQAMVVDKFVADMFISINDYNWLWGENRNELKIRDLGYYIGYEICERHYNKAKDKTKAIRELIQLDYRNEAAVESIVNEAGLLPKPLGELYSDYERQRPRVVSLSPFENGSQEVKPGIIQLSITFSQEMDTNGRGFEYGPLGEEHVYRFRRLLGWSNNDRTITIEVEVDQDKRYQVLINNRFRNKDGVGLKPFLVDFKTTH